MSNWAPRYPWLDRTLLAIWAFAVLQAVALALLQPIWSRVDEAAHVDLALRLGRHQAYPVMGETFLSREVVAVSDRVNQWGWLPANSSPPPEERDPERWPAVRDSVPAGEQREAWVRSNVARFSYEAMQPPLYYLLVAPLFGWFGTDTVGAIYAARVLTGIMASLVVLLAFLVARELRPGDRRFGLAAALMVAIVPGFAINLAQVTNDAAAALLGAVTLWLCLRAQRAGGRTRWAAVLGLTLGLALLTKLTTAFLIPVVFAALVLPRVRHRGLDPRVALDLAIAAGLALACLLPWLVRNLQTYGDPLGSAAARGLMGLAFPAQSPRSILGPAALAGYALTHLEQLVRTFWYGEPYPLWQFRNLGPVAVVVGGLALAGLLSAAKARGPAAPAWGLVALALAANLVLVLLFPFIGGLGVVGRYAYPSLVPLVVLLLLGLQRALPAPVRPALLSLLVVGLVLLNAANLVYYALL